MPFLGPCFDLRASDAAIAAVEQPDEAASEVTGSRRMLPGLSLDRSAPA